MPHEALPPEVPLHREMAEAGASLAVARPPRYVMPRHCRAYPIHTHHTTPGERRIETATETLTATDETGDRLRLGDRQ